MASLPESPASEQQQQESELLQKEYHLDIAPVAQPSSGTDATVPQLLRQGVPMLKVSAKKQKRYVFKLDPDQGQIVWESKQLRFSECGSFPRPVPCPPSFLAKPGLPLICALPLPSSD